MRIGPREIISVVLLTTIPLSAWWFVFRPNDERTDQMLQDTDAKRAKLNRLNEASRTIGDLKQEIALLGEAIDVLHSKLPNEREIDKVLEQIWELAKQNQLNPRSVETLNRDSDRAFTTSASTHAEQPVAIRVDGDFLGFYTFLQELERRARIMRIQKLTLRKSATGPEGSAEADFVMSIFFEKEAVNPT